MTSSQGRRKRISFARQEEVAGYLFISPWIIGFLCFLVGPMIVSFGLAFQQADFLTPSTFIGLQNYREMFKNPLFYKSLFNTSYYTFFRVPLGIVVSLGIALLLNRDHAGVKVFRTVYYLPSVVSGVPVALLWIWILNPSYGILNAGLRLIGLPKISWLYSETWAMPSLILMSLWGAGGSMLIYLAALRGVPAEMYEAASLDGANVVQKFFTITIPMITPTIFYNVVMGIINSFQLFMNSFIMTEGGPNNATLSYVLMLYNEAFVRYRMGYACALAWILFFILIAFTALVFRSSAAWVFYEGELKKVRR